MRDEPDSNDGREGPSEAWPPPGTGLWLLLTLAVSLGLVAVSLFPFTFGQPRGPLLSMRYPGTALVLLQVVLFVPMGVVEGELARRVLGGWRAGNWGVVLVGLDAALLALVCETLQYWVTTRTSSVVDVLAAAFGGVLGYMLATLWRGHPT
jgi:glycopeptide antibiotics resistance protein